MGDPKSFEKAGISRSCPSRTTWQTWLSPSDAKPGSCPTIAKVLPQWVHIVGKDGVKLGELYSVNVNSSDMSSYKNGLWIRHVQGGYGRKGYASIPDNTWIEVTHKGLPDTEKAGMWFNYAPGSGVWFNTGKTRIFENHAVAAQELCGWQHGDEPADLARCAKAKGLDSIQFQDDWGYPEGVELIAVNLEGAYPCGTAKSGRVDSFRSGWLASAPCSCDNNVSDGFLNCNLGVKSTGSPDKTPPSVPIVIL